MEQFEPSSALQVAENVSQASHLYSGEISDETLNWRADITYGGPQSDLHAKRKRNRLAQRKHREQVRIQQRPQPSTTDSKLKYGGETSRRHSNEYSPPLHSNPVSNISSHLLMQMTGTNPIYMESDLAIIAQDTLIPSQSLQQSADITNDTLLQNGFHLHATDEDHQDFTLNHDLSDELDITIHSSNATSNELCNVAPSGAAPPGSLEARIRHVLDAIESAGFESFDEAATAYYTATFSTGSLPQCAQSTSRVRRLRPFLTALRESSKAWVGREAQGYLEESLDAVRLPLMEELERLGEFKREGQKSDSKKRQFIVDMISQLLRDEASSVLCRQDKRYLQELLPEIWTLLSNMARQLGFSEMDGSQAVCVFIYMLTTSRLGYEKRP